MRKSFYCGLACVAVALLVRDASFAGGKPHRPGPPNAATGAVALIDSGGLDYFINTDITYATSSSASGAMSEASYTHAVQATTLNGGTTSSTLNDGFDGYNGLCLRIGGSFSKCSIPSADFVSYNQNGTATTECNGRQVVLPEQQIGNIRVSRKVFVPNNDEFARWLNIFTNTGGSIETVRMVTSNNLGSDSNTKIFDTSNGDTTADLTDTWVGTFQNYSGTTSSDPRLGHVLQGPGAVVSLAGIFFADGDGEPFWEYDFDLAPGQTRIIMNFVTGQPSKAAAAAKAAELVGVPTNATQCLSFAEAAAIGNFRVALTNQAPAPALDAVGMAAAALVLLTGGVYALRRRQ